MQNLKLWTLAAAIFTALSGCGDTALEQAILGAGAGAGAAVVTDGSPTTGAIIGAAANVAYCQKYPSRC